MVPEAKNEPNRFGSILFGSVRLDSYTSCKVLSGSIAQVEGHQKVKREKGEKNPPPKVEVSEENLL